MSPVQTVQILAAAVAFLFLAACATSKQWNSAGGSRESGVVRLAYEYPEFEQPEVSDEQAATLALNRCSAWGYTQAEPIAGLLRQCARMEGGDCHLWTVTREYQCSGGDSGDGSLASRFSR
jgi:hypothetical protein